MGEASGDDLRSTLASVLDELLPARDDGRLPGAGSLGLAEAVEAATGASALRPAIAAALASLAAEGFPSLSQPERLARLQALAKQSPEVFQALLSRAYGAYYTHPSVVAALGLPPRPPFPKGYDVPATDFSVLDPVRRRAKLYRDC
ncbi:MAG TPA: hypothetical protein VII72_06495 [Myxococcota bacterium]|jgi:hypothetical protein